MALLSTGFNEFKVLGRQASAFIRPVAGKMALGAGVGAAGGYAGSQDGSKMSGVLGGALGGAAAMGAIGMGYHKTFMRGGGTGGIMGGLNAVADRARGRWGGIARSLSRAR